MKNVEVLRNTEPEQELIVSSNRWQAAFDHRNERLSRRLPKGASHLAANQSHCDVSSLDFSSCRKRERAGLTGNIGTMAHSSDAAREL